MIGCFNSALFKKGLCNCNALKYTIKPNNKGSLGINNPKLSVNSSIFMERGVKNAMDINNLSV
jgi:hypothetical protein